MLQVTSLLRGGLLTNYPLGNGHLYYIMCFTFCEKEAAEDVEKEESNLVIRREHIQMFWISLNKLKTYLELPFCKVSPSKGKGWNQCNYPGEIPWQRAVAHPKYSAHLRQNAQ